MPIYKIADIVCKLKSNFKEFESKAKDYQYFGDEPPLIKFTIREDYVRQKYDDKMLMSIGGLENIFMSDIFNKKILKFINKRRNNHESYWVLTFFLYLAASFGASCGNTKVCKGTPEV